MERRYTTQAGAVIVLKPGDVIFVRYHGKRGSWLRERLNRAITWLPGNKGKRHAGYAHVAGLGENADPGRVVSAEPRGVVARPLWDWEGEDYSLMICRPFVMKQDNPAILVKHAVETDRWLRELLATQEALRARLGRELDRQVNLSYGRFGVLAQALDMLVSFGGRLWNKRPFSYIVARLEKANYCSETVAIGFFRAWEQRFIRWNTLKATLDPHIAQPKDLEWSAAALGWEVIYKTSHGSLGHPIHDQWITERLETLRRKHGPEAMVEAENHVVSRPLTR